MNCVCRPLNRRIVCALYIYFYTMARFAIYILDNTIFFQGPQIRVHALPENNFFKVNKKVFYVKKKLHAHSPLQRRCYILFIVKMTCRIPPCYICKWNVWYFKGMR